MVEVTLHIEKIPSSTKRKIYVILIEAESFPSFPQLEFPKVKWWWINKAVQKLPLNFYKTHKKIVRLHKNFPVFRLKILWLESSVFQLHLRAFISQNLSGKLSWSLPENFCFPPWKIPAATLEKNLPCRLEKSALRDWISCSRISKPFGWRTSR